MNNYTIILAHGIARFDFLTRQFAKSLDFFGMASGLVNNELNYFKGIGRHLRNNGFNVHQSAVNFAGKLELRANDLKTEVETALALRSEQSKVHIIGHSMGGLDARFMIAKLGMAEKVSSLTTIGTPHHGTSFADWGIANEGDELIEILEKVIDLRGFADLTTGAAENFNQSVEPIEAGNDVFYQTYSSHEQKSKIFAPLKPAWQIIFENEGDNDGLVPVISQRWKDKLIAENGNVKTIHQFDFPVSADHLNEIGWWDRNQIEISELLHTDLISSIIDYENKIKDVYLKIAQKVRQLP